VTRHLAIVGATASGKSALAFALASGRDDVEIVSPDAMQVYREMDIGTAKPTPRERAAVPHHLIDVADPAEEWSVRATQDAARDAVAGIEGRGNRAVFVGGTGLYVRAVVDALDVPGHDPAVRAALEEATATPDGLQASYARLVAADPAAASRIEPGNRRRIVRALEVIALTGRLFSSFGPGLATYGPPALDVTLVGVGVDRNELSRRIVERFVAMRAAGLVDEVRALAGRPGGLSRTARQAIGYKEVLAHLAAGGSDESLDESLATAVVRTRQLARRQRVWFRRDPRITWLPAGENPGTLVPAALARWKSDAVTGATAS
jgi:tRNA dimethylallyltransferase